MKIIIATLFVVFTGVSTAQNLQPQKKHEFILKTDVLSHLSLYFPSLSIAGEWRYNRQFSLMADLGVVYSNSFFSNGKYSNQQGFRLKLEPRIYLGSKKYFYITPSYHYMDAKMNMRYYYQEQISYIDTMNSGYPYEYYEMINHTTSLTVKKMHHAAAVKFGLQKIFNSGFVLDFTFGLGIRATRTTVDGKPISDNYIIPKKKNFIHIPIDQGWSKYPDINLSIRVGYRF